MKLPESVIRNGKRAIESLWQDVATIQRKQKTGHVKGDVIVYDRIYCHLSQSVLSPLRQQKAAQVASAYVLYVSTEVMVLPGDVITVTHNGQTFRGIAGKPFHRAFSNVARLEEVVTA